MICLNQTCKQLIRQENRCGGTGLSGSSSSSQMMGGLGNLGGLGGLGGMGGMGGGGPQECSGNGVSVSKIFLHPLFFGKLIQLSKAFLEIKVSYVSSILITAAKQSKF